MRFPFLYALKRYIIYNHNMTTFGTCNFSNADIQKLYITKWDSDVLTYFDTDGVVTNMTGFTDNWQQIKINTVQVLYNQTMNEPNPNGINYSERVTIFIPHSDINKWMDLIDVLTDYYVIVFQDGNNNWFTMGWRFGTKVESYGLEQNQYNLEFINNSSTSMLTPLTEDYVNSNF